MIRLIVRTLVALAGNAVGLIVAAAVLDDMEVDAGSFVVAVILFTVVMALLQPFLAVQLRLLGPSALGGVALIATFASLLVTDLLSDGFSVSGVTTWIAATVIVWLVSLLAVFVLPFLGLRKYLETRRTLGNVWGGGCRLGPAPKSSGVSSGEKLRTEIFIPMRMLLLVAAAVAVGVAFRAIGDTFLIVFVGIFLGLVFEYPVRFVTAHTPLSRGLAATVTVLGTAIAVFVLALLLLAPLVGSVRDFLQQLPSVVEDLREAGGLSSLGDTGAAGNVQNGAEEIAKAIPDAISELLGIAGTFFGVFLAAFTILFICLFLLTDVGNLKRSLASVLMPDDEERAPAVWERVTESISRWAIGIVVIATIAGTTQGLTAFLLGSSYAVRDAYMLLSQCGKVRLGNFVDPKYTVGAAISRKYLATK